MTARQRIVVVAAALALAMVSPRVARADYPGCDGIGNVMAIDNCLANCCYNHDHSYEAVGCTAASWRDTVNRMVQYATPVIMDALAVSVPVALVAAQILADLDVVMVAITAANVYNTCLGGGDCLDAIKEALLEVPCSIVNTGGILCFFGCKAGVFYDPLGCGPGMNGCLARDSGQSWCSSDPNCCDAPLGAATNPDFCYRPPCNIDGGGPQPGDCTDACGVDHFQDNVTITEDRSCQDAERIVHVRSCDYTNWNQCLDCNVDHCAPGCPDTSCAGICDQHNACGDVCMDCSCVCPGCAPRDCTGGCGNAQVDCNGTCNGGAQVDCNGTCNGGAQVDSCGQCGGDGSECACSWYDCAGTCNGGATVDCAGTCNGGATYDCAGQCNGGRTVDSCGVCGGDGSECACYYYDCQGTCNGGATVDACGVCGGNGSECACSYYDCQGTCNGGAAVDACGVCGGDGSSCACSYYDCAGVCNGGDQYDGCGVCGGDGSECGGGGGGGGDDGGGDDNQDWYD